jgi:hypothetical protein
VVVKDRPNRAGALTPEGEEQVVVLEGLAEASGQGLAFGREVGQVTDGGGYEPKALGTNDSGRCRLGMLSRI